MKIKDNKHSKKRIKDKINKKKLLLPLAIILIIIIIAVVIIISQGGNNNELDSSEEGLKLYDTTLSEYVKETDDGTKLNISTALNVDKKIGNLDVTNIQLTESGGITTLSAKVTNNTSEATALKSIWVVFLDENGEELYKARGIVGALDAYGTTNLNVSMSSSYVTAYDIEFRE